MALRDKIKSSLINIVDKYRKKNINLGREFYKSDEKDLFDVRVYTLENGLKIYLSRLPNMPIIETRIVVKSGSSHDPEHATGLAHYLEHMLFKGSKHFGTTNYSAEKKLIDKIKELYNKYRVTTDDLERKKIWDEINKVSSEASKYAIANEYDKMLNFMGATGTNAHTSNEETVYKNNIPKDQLDIWLRVEKERFTYPVFRLFQTELEVVYEEMNRYLANEDAKGYSELLKTLFPTHPYGQRMTIGTQEHLKNPSLEEIENYFKKYYVANNMAICLSGDIDFDKTYKLLKQYWGDYRKDGNLKIETCVYEKNMVEPIRKTIVGLREPMLFMGFRLKGITLRDMVIIEIIDTLLYNGISGLIDQNLVNNHRIYGSYSYMSILREYSFHLLLGIPKGDISLRQLEELFKLELQRIKAGEFSEELLNSVKLNIGLNWKRASESNAYRLENLTKAFVLGIEWKDYLENQNLVEAITKEDITRFVIDQYSNNYVSIYREQSDSVDMEKFPNPPIEPIEINCTQKSLFLKNILRLSGEIEIKSPELFDFSNTDNLKNETIDGLNILYKNSSNRESIFFELRYVYDIGLNNNEALDISMEYLNSAILEDKNLKDIKNQFYLYGCSYGIYTDDEKIQIILKGSNTWFDKSVEFLEDILNNFIVDEDILSGIKDNYKMENMMNKTDKGKIREAIIEYIKYGEKSKFKRRLNGTKLDSLGILEVDKNIKSVLEIKHRIFYYGDKSYDEFNKIIKSVHIKKTYKQGNESKSRVEQLLENKKIYYYNFNMPQAEMVILREKEKLEDVPKLINDLAKINLYNSYFGMGMSSRVFQEIREAKALAYTAYSYYSVPYKQKNKFYNVTYIGTQYNKLEKALECIFSLLEKPLEIKEKDFDLVKRSYKLKLSTKRLLCFNSIIEHERLNNLGITYDVEKTEYAKTIYDSIEGVNSDDIKKFHIEINKGKSIIAMIGPSEAKSELEKQGEITLLTDKDIFNL